ncbi:MAG: energy transducer TonB [Bacteroidetes bacterium]|nr:energy transducer TonB [Bacteroidota bacterium]
MKTFSNNWDNPISTERLALVFQDRNQAYGAYIIRRDYNRTVIKAVLLSFIGLTLLVLTPSIVRHFSPEKIILPFEKPDVILDITEVILPDEIIPLPEKTEVQPPTPPSSSKQYTNLLVRDVDSISKGFTQEDLSKLTLATKTNDVDSVPGKDPMPDTKDNTGNGNTKTFIWVEEMPMFLGGENEMLKFIRKNIKYPSAARENNISGIVNISFIVDQKGEIKNIELLRGIGGGCEEEAIRVIKTMPTWKPGKQNGQAVNVQFQLPISFTLK